MRVTEVVAMTLYLECRGEPPLGQIAVGCVIRNRARDRRWPSAMDQVCLQDKQFSCWNHTSPARKQSIVDWEDPVWDKLFRLAKAFTDDLIPDVTNGANHYLNPKAVREMPWWASEDKLTFEVGRHKFYRL